MAQFLAQVSPSGQRLVFQELPSKQLVYPPMLWDHRQLESSTTGADLLVQLLPPVPVQVFQLILGWVSV
jgi:hypothetical protein